MEKQSKEQDQMYVRVGPVVVRLRTRYVRTVLILLGVCLILLATVALIIAGGIIGRTPGTMLHWLFF